MKKKFLLFVLLLGGMLAYSNSMVSNASSYNIPELAGSLGPDRYITSAATTGGITNIDYLADAAPGSHYIYHTENGVTAKQGTVFTLNLTAFANPFDLEWCQAIILVDWNQDFDFADSGERIAIIGKEQQGNPELANISQLITVPADAVAGKTRIRVVYTDSWRKTNPDYTFEDLGDDPVHTGRVYDFDITVTTTSTGIDNNDVNIQYFYPNPAKDFINFASENNKVEIYSLKGELIKIKSKGQKQLNISDLNNGVYLIKIYNMEDVITRKFIVNK